MPQPALIRGRKARPSKHLAPITAAFALLLALTIASVAIAATSAATSAVHFYPDGLPASVGTQFQVDFNPSTVFPEQQTPNSLAFYMPKGFVVNTKSVTKRCTQAQAVAVNCPQASRIGFGYINVNVFGYLLPGGETNGVVYLKLFLAAPLQAGDAAGVVMEAHWLGLDQAFQELNHFLPLPLKANTSFIGRLFKVNAGQYGLELLFAGLPGGLELPPPIADAGIGAKMTVFKLEMGAIRRVKKPVVHVEKLGTVTERIHDHVLIPEHLLARPKACPGSGMWPWKITVGFPSGVNSLPGQVSCHP